MTVSVKKITRIFLDGKSEEKEILFLNEHNFSITVNGMFFCSIVCTKDNLMELLVGHLLSSGVIENKSDILSISFSKSNENADVFLSSKSVAHSSLKKLSFCDVRPEWIFNIVNEFSNDGAIHKYTSGTHICILAKNGKPIFTAEDIGRHSALDKALGYMLLNDIPPEQVQLFISGRVPVDMVEKVIRAKVGVLISKSVPTEQSLKLASDFGVKLIFRAWPDSYEYLLDKKIY